MTAKVPFHRNGSAWCEAHQEWYVPFTGPGDPNGVPCPGCLTEAEARWREAEDHNIRTLLELPE